MKERRVRVDLRPFALFLLVAALNLACETEGVSGDPMEATEAEVAATEAARVVDSGTLTVSSGTRINVHLNQRLNSGETQAGQRFTMSVSEAVRVNNQVAIPAGSEVSGTVSEVEKAERPQKGGKLVLQAEQVTVRGRNHPLHARITAEGARLEGEGSLREDLKEIAIGAGVGAALGGLIRGRKGALIGLIIGGTGTFLATKGEEVDLPSETPLIVELTRDLKVAGS